MYACESDSPSSPGPPLSSPGQLGYSLPSAWQPAPPAHTHSDNNNRNYTPVSQYKLNSIGRHISSTLIPSQSVLRTHMLIKIHWSSHLPDSSNRNSCLFLVDFSQTASDSVSVYQIKTTESCIKKTKKKTRRLQKIPAFLSAKHNKQSITSPPLHLHNLS